MLENAESHLIDAILAEISLQIVRAFHLRVVGQLGVCDTGCSFSRPPASNSSKATPHGSILA
jgi:hypothetical protein